MPYWNEDQPLYHPRLKELNSLIGILSPQDGECEQKCHVVERSLYSDQMHNEGRDYTLAVFKSLLHLYCIRCKHEKCKP